ncbi:trafficking protein particle complex subunit 1-like [Ictidomys tridecemlineatus]
MDCVCTTESGTARGKQGSPRRRSMKDGFLAFQTSLYKLHYYRTPTGIKAVMKTDLGLGPIRDVLHHIYRVPSVELVVKNPLRLLGQTVQSELFGSGLDY